MRYAIGDKVRWVGISVLFDQDPGVGSVARIDRDIEVWVNFPGESCPILCWESELEKVSVDRSKVTYADLRFIFTLDNNEWMSLPISVKRRIWIEAGHVQGLVNGYYGFRFWLR